MKRFKIVEIHPSDAYHGDALLGSVVMLEEGAGAYLGKSYDGLDGFVACATVDDAGAERFFAAVKLEELPSSGALRS